MSDSRPDPVEGEVRTLFRPLLFHALVPLAVTVVLGGLVGWQTWRVQDVSMRVSHSLQAIKQIHTAASWIDKAEADEVALLITHQFGYGSSLRDDLDQARRAIGRLGTESSVLLDEQTLQGSLFQLLRQWTSEIERLGVSGAASQAAALKTSRVRGELRALLSRVISGEHTHLNQIQGAFLNEAHIQAPIAITVLLLGAFFFGTSLRRVGILDRAYRRHLALLEELKAAEAIKDQFLDMVSHELRTPIQVITSSVALIKRKLIGQPASQACLPHVDKIHRASHTLTTLVSDLLDASQFQSGQILLHPRQVHLWKLALDIVQHLNPLAEQNGQKLQVHVPPNLPGVECDPSRVGQVLTNLLSNAIKYGPPDRPIAVRARNLGDFVRVEIRDEGAGIPEDRRQQLFQRFSRLDPATRVSGRGLGLFICKSLVEAHGGEIGVDSILGHGTTFWFTLPFRSPVGQDASSVLPLSSARASGNR